MVWITKREIAYYIIIRYVFKDKSFNIGEALDALTVFGSKKIARKIIRRLVSRGLLEKIDAVTYRAKDLEDVLANKLKEYITERMIRVLKSGRLNVERGLEGEILIYNCENQFIASVSKSLNNLINIKYICR